MIRPRVLIVDDDLAVAGVHQGFVVAHGRFEVVGLAHSGAEAIHAITQRNPDLVLLDIDLPDMTGLDVLRALPDGHAVDVLAITAARELDMVQQAVSVGVWHYLVKPFPVATLHERLDHYLTYVERRRELRQSGTLDQDDIDRLLGVGAAPPRSSAALPKGLAVPTLELVRSTLNQLGEASATEVAESAGLARVSARRYLEHLVESGEAEIRPRYGHSGRPVNGYRLH